MPLLRVCKNACAGPCRTSPSSCGCLPLYLYMTVKQQRCLCVHAATLQAQGTLHWGCHPTPTARDCSVGLQACSHACSCLFCTCSAWREGGPCTGAATQSLLPKTALRGLMHIQFVLRVFGLEERLQNKKRYHQSGLQRKKKVPSSIDVGAQSTLPRLINGIKSSYQMVCG